MSTPKTPWQASVITGAKHLGQLEVEDGNGDLHVFEVLETSSRLVFGGAANTGFLESGYIVKDMREMLQETLQELVADLETFYKDGPRYVSRIVHNDRM